jgi:hypothetical protein
MPLIPEDPSEIAKIEQICDGTSLYSKIVNSKAGPRAADY